MTKLKGIHGKNIRSTLASQENLERTGRKALRQNAQVKIWLAPASCGEKNLLQKVMVVWDSIPAAADRIFYLVSSTVGILAAGWQLSPPTKLRMARGSLLEETWTAAEGVRSYAQVKKHVVGMQWYEV